MPAVRKVSKEQIIDAAVEVLRDDGFSAINARSVAKKLGCSTQPIYFSFKSMEELKSALTERAIELHTQHVRDFPESSCGKRQSLQQLRHGICEVCR